MGQQQHKRQLDAFVDVLTVVDDLAVVDVLAVVDICRKATVLLWTGAWPIPAYDKPELARPRKVILRVLKSRKMTYRGLANSGL